MSGWLIASFVAWVVGLILILYSQREDRSTRMLAWGVGLVVASLALLCAESDANSRDRLSRIESRLDALERAAPRVGSR